MKKIIFPLFILTVSLISCTSNDEPDKDLNCQEDRNQVSMTRFVKSDSRSNEVINSYTYNEKNLLASRTRTSPTRNFEYTYVYDCSNNLVERLVDETKDPQYDASDYFYTYDEQNRLVGFSNTYQGESNYELSYNGNVVTASGIIGMDENASISMQLNSLGQVIRLDRNADLGFVDQVITTTFAYDTNGNLVKVEDFDHEGNLKYSISIFYDDNTNPYYDQFKSIYLQRFISLFYDAGYWASDTISTDAFKFPYLKNNMTSVVDNLCNPCYEEVVKRVYHYDDQVYPQKFSLSYWGAPGTETEIEYYE
ncbi:hypothetical protein LCM02_04840 [Lutimonas saemankumensis]|uniref:hypothetical protein n=1 Tax=Lutimonas saemankumensis TaxID=483016 RepID=UPI001CD81472|nr:hypothetical protein [Lutimonas saemankumensis]MCA0931768.1 hypothetical protein [Lutimonas saemankumensis]